MLYLMSLTRINFSFNCQIAVWGLYGVYMEHYYWVPCVHDSNSIQAVTVQACLCPPHPRISVLSYLSSWGRIHLMPLWILLNLSSRSGIYLHLTTSSRKWEQQHWCQGAFRENTSKILFIPFHFQWIFGANSPGPAQTEGGYSACYQQIL